MKNDIGATFGGIDGVIRQCEHLKTQAHGYFERGFYEVLIAYLEDYKRQVNIYEKENGEYKRIEKYEREQTEREYLNSLSDEEFAEWILDVSDECFDCGKSDNGDCPFGKAQGVCTCINKDSVVKWLKQPHTSEE